MPVTRFSSQFKRDQIKRLSNHTLLTLHVTIASYKSYHPTIADISFVIVKGVGELDTDKLKD